MRRMAALACVAGALWAAPETHPLTKDRTGMTWVLPFKAAHEKAQKEKRLLMIKPVAFGTTRDGGW
ncbi:MAG: hypothetical protein O7E54_13915 [Planctomycetota bacterium]|nr:hypothetical protein [Planctomycetota bacterium]